MQMKGSVQLSVGGIHFEVFGGPYSWYKQERRLVGVKMAEEIDKACNVDIPTKDFSIPDANVMQKGVIKALWYVISGNDLYVGCMGGIGRTGLFMGVLFKAIHDYEGRRFAIEEASYDPVAEVRKKYISSSIETQEQQRFVREFDTGPIVDFLDNKLTSKVVVEIEYPGFWAYMRWFFFGRPPKA